MLTPAQIKLQQLLAARKAATAATPDNPTPAAITITSPVQTAPTAPELPTGAITLNEEQQRAVELARQGIPFCLIGAAGTGKTTTVKEIVRVLSESDMPRLRTSTKHLQSGSPAIALVSYTNRAVKNIAKACKELPEIARHCITIHKLLEFAPVWYDVPSPDSPSGFRKTMRFEPTFTAENPLRELKLVIVDEASMCDTRLFKQLQDACPGATFVFLGDLNQLPPVFGDAILGFKLLELEVVELTKVYRQAMESPIIAFQHNYTLKGMVPAQSELEKITEQQRGLTFQFMKKPCLDDGILNRTFGKFFFDEYLAGRWKPEDDIILIPFNKGFGTVGLNQEIAGYLGEHRGAVVHHIIAGRENKFFAVGDRVIFEKQEWEVAHISTNSKYFGKLPNPSSAYMNRRGNYKPGHMPAGMDMLTQDLNLEQMLEAMGNDDGTTLAASHILTLKSLEEADVEVSLESAGEINSVDFGYCTTIHKSQGSEWRKVYLIMTNFHSSMLSRELLYTGMTRAREELHCIASPATAIGKRDGSFQRAIKKQRIPGVGWRQKAQAFKGKQEDFNEFMNS